ncbi:MAG TPA: hypothetical protein VFU59_09460 [Candidatus Eisenbacteria bacterium]|nr:hypothetical protein [Candidatus Eisenbacteria bacterium]
MLIALTALPGVWNFQAPGNAFGPATAWAGGTPDETLNPPATPPKKSSSVGFRGDFSTSTPRSAITDRSSGFARLSTIERIKLIWTIVRASTLRM